MLIVLALFGAVCNWIAWKQGFYSMPPENRERLNFLTFKQVAALFAIFISCSLFIPSFLSILPQFKNMLPIQSLAWIQAITLFVALLLLLLYSSSFQRTGMKHIWKEGKEQSWLRDLAFGGLCWFLTFPLITVLGHLIDLGVQALFETGKYEQVAIRFLKMALDYAPMMLIALLTIVIIAPVLEEFLFRGILQNWLQKHLGRKGGIALSSLAFALFHFAPSQKAGNIPLFLTLFVFACFLGFLYEKKKSLFTPIGLHIAYNLLSSIQVIYFETSL